MQVRSVRSAGTSVPVVVGMYEGRKPAPGATTAKRDVGAVGTTVFDATGFTGELGQSALVTTATRSYVFVGLGSELDAERLRQAAGTGRKAVPKSTTVATTLHKIDLAGALDAVLEGFAFSDYSFSDYLPSAEPTSPLELELVGAPQGWEPAAERASVVAEAVDLARDLVNTPSRDKAPMAFAERVQTAASDTKLTVEVWDVDRLGSERMGGIIGVGQGSDRPPCLVVMTHKTRRPKAKIAIVGKGITFDSGGLSIKPAAAMELMKSDMSGAAAVMAAVIAISKLGLRVDVTAYAAMAENLPGGAAQRPSDVVTARNGKTIEIINTDAEGRLVLADALSLAAESEPDLIVDLATLTGACKVALGEKIAGLWSNDESVTEQIVGVAEAAGERVWPMPQPRDYWTLIESDIADMRNSSSSRYGSAMAATLLLEEFVDDRPWAHLDIAGPAFMSKAEHYIPKGGTGFGVRTLIELAVAMGG